MPNVKKPRAQAETSALALPWKNSLLAKEDQEKLQNPVNYFLDIVQNNDTFAILFEEILDNREEGVLFGYLNREEEKTNNLVAFLIVQDRHGVHWICPVHADVKGKVIEHDVRPLNMATDDTTSTYLGPVLFGSIKIDKEEYIHACSRGFENASRVFLGDHRVRMLPDYSLIAAFYLFPKEDKK